MYATARIYACNERVACSDAIHIWVHSILVQIHSCVVRYHVDKFESPWIQFGKWYILRRRRWLLRVHWIRRGQLFQYLNLQRRRTHAAVLCLIRKVRISSDCRHFASQEKSLNYRNIKLEVWIIHGTSNLKNRWTLDTFHNMHVFMYP